MNSFRFKLEAEPKISERWTAEQGGGGGQFDAGLQAMQRPDSRGHPELRFILTISFLTILFLYNGLLFGHNTKGVSYVGDGFVNLLVQVCLSFR